jgi:hypothetical protein
MDQGTHSVTSTDELSPPQSRSTHTPVFSRLTYVVVICLMLVALAQTFCIFGLKSKLKAMGTELTRANDSIAMISLRLNSFEARDPAYQSAKIAIAWDSFQHHGVISAQNLPAPSAGYNYQLWVLDPGAQAPLSAGLVHLEKISTPFTVSSLSTVNPGFAITLEPGGGSPEPTGSILFAVAPGQ